MKNATKILIAIGGVALIGVSTYSMSLQNTKTQNVDTLRIQAEEARLREEQARRDREAREDNLSQALYDQCYSQSIALTGARFEEKQKRAYECWRTNTNGTGTLAPASEPPSRPIISKISQNVSSKSTVGSTQTKTPSPGSKVQPIGKTQGKGVATSLQSGSKVPQYQTISPSGKAQSQGKEANYWTAYETAIKLIRKWEGLKLHSYWDISHCSIGYGFSYSCGKSITQKQADQMLSERVHSDLAIIRSDFPKLHYEAQGALVSFKHNCPAGYQSIRKNGLQWFNSWCKTAGGDRLNGLVKRRAEESRLIFSKN